MMGKLIRSLYYVQKSDKLISKGFIKEPDEEKIDTNVNPCADMLAIKSPFMEKMFFVIEEFIPRCFLKK